MTPPTILKLKSCLGQDGNYTIKLTKPNGKGEYGCLAVYSFIKKKLESDQHFTHFYDSANELQEASKIFQFLKIELENIKNFPNVDSDLQLIFKMLCQ
jgi:hypothetical protein